MQVKWTGPYSIARLAIAIGLALIASCGGGSSNSGSSACGKFFDSIITRITRCDGYDNFDEIPTLNSNSAFAPSYRATFVSFCEKQVSGKGSGLTVAYLDSCATALGQASCLSANVAACNNPLGTLANGEACESALQCSGGICSSAESGNGTSACGVCSSMAAAGKPCTGDIACLPGLACLSDNGSNSPTCVAISAIPIGGTCSLTGVTPGPFCVDGSICSNASGDGTSYVCVTPPGAGQSCTPEGICNVGLVCVNNLCITPVGAGANCPTGSECKPQLFCDGDTQKCAAPTIVQVGAACDDNSNIYCADGLQCTGGVCAAYSQASQSCSDNVHCAPYLACVNSVCVFPDPAQCT